MSENIEQRVKEIVVEQLGVNPEQVTREASFVDDLGADSMDLFQIVMAVEEEFHIEIPQDDLENIVTVADALKRITGEADL